MTKRQFLAPIAILPVVALALVGCTNNEKPAPAGAGPTAPAVVSGAATVPADGPVRSLAPGAHGEDTPAESAPSAGAAEAPLIKPDGSSAGKATFTEKDGVVVVDVRVTGLPAGFHGVHIHEVGKCETGLSVAANGAAGSASNFGSAGGHWQKSGATGHPATGDLVSIYVNANGTGQTVSSTGAFALADLKKNTGGTALMIHADADNFGNIPPRYTNVVPGQPVPDETTMKTGDAGARIACGVIKVG